MVNKNRSTPKTSQADNLSKRIRPPLKWAGGKFQIIHDIQSLLPSGNRLIEPFVGSGVVSLNTEFDKYTINDKNVDLINFYKSLKKEKNTFIDYCRQFFIPENNTPDKYYEFRKLFNETLDIKLKSALFLYINKHGYNGLCRYNSSGGLNVPFGKRLNSHFPEDEMHYFIRKFKHITIKSEDFETIMNKAKTGDVIYCDPPYVPLSETSFFTSYSVGGFGQEDQIRLAKAAQDTANNGIPVLISNHNTPFTRKIYKAATKKSTVSVRRFISCNGSKRNYVEEILALYLPK